MNLESIKCKVVLLGDSGVGKSSILRRIKFDNFSHEVDSTIGCEFFAKEYIIKNKSIKLLLWDTAGQEVFRSFTPNFLRGAKIVLIVYDLTKKISEKSIEEWVIEANKIPNIKIIVLGNKFDGNKFDENDIIVNNIIEKYKDIDIYNFGYVSAKNNHNINNLFHFVSTQIANNLNNKFPEIVTTNNVNLTEKKNNETKNFCCT